MDNSFDPLFQPYVSQRFPIYARGGMVNTSSPQASAAGLEILRRGGNAIDAAVAAAATLTVTEPTACGIGGDAFAIVWSQKEKCLYGLNASGKAPNLATIERLTQDGSAPDGKILKDGWAPVTVPGVPAAWAELTGRFGTLSLYDLMEPAIGYARDGYPCSPNLSTAWKNAFGRYSQYRSDPRFDAWFDTFAPEGRPYEAGDMIFLPDHAATLALIGESGSKTFYQGAVAHRIDAESRRFGGYLRYEDLASYEAQWVDPIRVNYRGYDVFEIPPNGQGIVALMALNIMKEFSFEDREDPMRYHRQIEAVKMAFADAFRYVTDPDHMTVRAEDLLRPEYGEQRAREMTDRAQIWTYRVPPRSGTVYLCCADGEGNMISYIQSNYTGFGSGMVVRGTGIALQNRGADFSLDPNEANCLMPGKRTYHTIIPGFLMKDGVPVGPFGVMGAYMQPQGHVQVLTNMLDFHLDPQQALDAPRWQWMRTGQITVENRFDEHLAEELRKLGHDVRREPVTASFGRGQIILRGKNGVLIGGTESRTDSNIACY